jgi:class 3 adenylate cyclase
MTDITTWLAGLGLEKYASRFLQEEVDLDALPLLKEPDLEAMGLPLGPRRKVMRAIGGLPGATQGEASGAPSGTAPARAEGGSPGDLARRALAHESAAAGERKLLSILFADLRGSTALIQGLDAEDAVERLHPAVEAMTRAVQHYQGTVNRVQGDGIMALFGAPIAQEDHALRACLAGLQMRDEILALKDPALALRVGIHFGEAVVRRMRNDLTAEYEADGPAVHLAARMEQLADAGTVRVTHDVWRLVDGHVDGRPLGLLPVKGLAEPVAQYELVAPSSAASRWEGRARRGLTRFVGRERELAVLQEAAAQAADGRGQMVALVGDAGMGKSRLLHEFLESPGMRTWTVRVTAASPHGTTSPYLPLKQLLRRVIDVAADGDSRDVGERLDTHLSQLDPALRVLRSPLRALLDLDPEDDRWAALQPGTRRRQTVDAIRELVMYRARDAPLLLLVEDLHWLDEETQNVLDRLVDAIGVARLLLLVTYRPEYRHPWNGKSYFVAQRVGPIPERQVADLLDGLLGTDDSLSPLKADIESRSEGRPLYVEEIARELVDRDVLVGEPGNYRLTRPDVPIPVPDTVQAVIGARIDRLEPAHKWLLQVASVIGREVPRDLLREAASVPDDELSTGLAALQAGEFLFEFQSFPTQEYLFKHALTENAAYDGLLRRRRRALHEAVLRAMERRHASRIEPHVELLAHHALNAELWPEATEYLRQAGHKALTASAYTEAVEHLERALGALEHLPDSPERTSLAVDIRLELRPALGARAAYDRLFTRLTEARALARSLGDRLREAYIAADNVHVLYHLGQIETAIEAGEEAVNTARAVGDQRVLTLAASNHAHAYHCAGKLEESLAIAAPFAGLLTGEFRHERIGATSTSSCIWLGNLCGTCSLLGEFERGIAFGEEAGRIADETGLPFDRVMSGTWLAWGLSIRGQGEAAVALGERNEEIIAANDLEFVAIWNLMQLARADVLEDQADRALRRIEESAPLRTRLRNLVIMSSWMDAVEVLVIHATGDYERAAARADEVLEQMARVGAGLYEPLALRVRGQCAAVLGDLEGASRWLERALARAAESAQRPEVALAELAIAGLRAEQGNRGAVRTVARRAHDAFESMGMTHWLADARALCSD